MNRNEVDITTRLNSATDFLKFSASNYGHFGDLESLIFLASRGHECEKEINKTISSWRVSEKKAIEQFAQGISIYDLSIGKNRKQKDIPTEDIQGISQYSNVEIYDFWIGATGFEQYVIDSTMLRSVEWLEIGGFEEWWVRLYQTIKENIYSNALPYDDWSAFWLFNMCRSSFALNNAQQPLRRLMENITQVSYGQTHPWQRRRSNDNSGPAFDEAIDLAGAIAFSGLRLQDGNNHQDVINNCLKVLLKNQRENGAWGMGDIHRKPLILPTCIALHALALGRPHGWKRACVNGANWLWSVQGSKGGWFEKNCPSEAYLTVLALDAIELSHGGSKVTFRDSSSSYVGLTSDAKADHSQLLAKPAQKATQAKKYENLTDQRDEFTAGTYEFLCCKAIEIYKKGMLQYHHKAANLIMEAYCKGDYNFEISKEIGGLPRRRLSYNTLKKELVLKMDKNGLGSWVFGRKKT